jgi:hypothetical protein
VGSSLHRSRPPYINLLLVKSTSHLYNGQIHTGVPIINLPEEQQFAKYVFIDLRLIMNHLIGKFTAPASPSKPSPVNDPQPSQLSPVDPSQPGRADADEREALPGRPSTEWETYDDLEIAKQEYLSYLKTYTTLSRRKADPVAIFLAEQHVISAARILDWITDLRSTPLEQPDPTAADPGSPTYSEFSDIPPMQF